MELPKDPAHVVRSDNLSSYRKKNYGRKAISRDIIHDLLKLSGFISRTGSMFIQWNSLPWRHLPNSGKQVSKRMNLTES